MVAVDAGWGHSLALRRNGTLWAWEDNGAGTLGMGTDRQSAPVPVVGLTQVRELASGLWHMLAVRGDGTVHALRGDGTAVGWGAISAPCSAVASVPCIWSRRRCRSRAA